MSYECAICSKSLQLSGLDKIELARQIREAEGRSLEVETLWREIGRAIREQTKVVATYCGHLYHRPCIMQWIQIRHDQELPTTCPYCAHELEEEELVRLSIKYAEGSSTQSAKQAAIEKRRKAELFRPDLNRLQWLDLYCFTIFGCFFFMLVIFIGGG